MLRGLTILFILLCGWQSWAQTDNLASDSLLQVKADSVQSQFEAEHARLDSIQLSAERFYDSLRNPTALDSARMYISGKHQQLDSLERGYQDKLKELTTLKIPPGKLNNRIDSLNKVQENAFNKVNGSITKLETDAKEKWNSKKKKFLGKLSPVRDSLGIKQTGGGQDLNIPGLEGEGLDNLDGVKLDAGIEMPESLSEGVNTGDLKLDDPLKQLGDPLKDLSALPQTELQRLTDVEELNNIKSGVGEVKDIKGKAGEYSNELSEYKDGKGVEKLSKKAEERARNVGDMKELSRHEKKMEALRAEREKQLELVQQYQDKDFIRKQLNDRTKNVANEELINKNDKVKEATAQLGKHKKKFSEIQSVNDLPKRPPNPMKGKGLRERLLPGVVFQIQKKDILSVFIAPQVNYKITGRWTAGGGALLRLRGTVNDSLRYIGHNMIYGFKTYGSFTVIKGFALRAEWEPLRVPLPLNLKTESPYTKWVNGYLVGLDKGFTVNRKWKGDMQVLYNFGYKKEETPYANRINFRFGFFLDLKKKRKLPGM